MEGGLEALELGNPGVGARFGSDWQSAILPRLGNYRLWVDKGGRLRPFTETDPLGRQPRSYDK